MRPLLSNSKHSRLQAPTISPDCCGLPAQAVYAFTYVALQALNQIKLYLVEFNSMDDTHPRLAELLSDVEEGGRPPTPCNTAQEQTWHPRDETVVYDPGPGTPASRRLQSLSLRPKEFAMEL